MNIDWVIPCRYIEVHDNLGTIIGAGIDTYWVKDLPAPIQAMLAIRLVGPPDELTADQEHTASSRVKNPDGEVISEVTGSFQIELHSAKPGWLAGMIVPAVVQFEAAEEGTYTVEQTVDSASYSVPLHIVHGAPPGAE